MSDESRWRGRPTSVPGGSGLLTFPPLDRHPYPGAAASVLTGWPALRFRLRLAASGYPTVAAFQRSTVRRGVGIVVDGLPGPQTWAAYWLRREEKLVMNGAITLPARAVCPRCGYLVRTGAFGLFAAHGVFGSRCSGSRRSAVALGAGIAGPTVRERFARRRGRRR